MEEIGYLMSWVTAVRKTNLLLVKALLTRKIEGSMYLILMNLGITRARLHAEKKFRWLKNREWLKRRYLKWFFSEGTHNKKHL